MTNDRSAELTTKPISNDQWWWAHKARRLLVPFDGHPQLVIGHWDLVIAPDHSRAHSRIIRAKQTGNRRQTVHRYDRQACSGIASVFGPAHA